MIEFDQFFAQYVRPFQHLSWRYLPDVGFIVWRQGTGDNVELLHIRSQHRRQGYGRRLVYAMLDALRVQPPYYSIYGYTRVSNTRAAAFYEALGFHCQTVDGIYQEGAAVLFWCDYTGLLAAKAAWEARQ